MSPSFDSGRPSQESGVRLVTGRSWWVVNFVFHCSHRSQTRPSQNVATGPTVGGDRMVLRELCGVVRPSSK